MQRRQSLRAFGGVPEIRRAPSGFPQRRARGAHASDCGCVNCQRAENSRSPDAPRVATVTPARSSVVQAKWKCANCEEEGDGKKGVDDRCPGCGKKGHIQEVLGKPAFGTWWEGLTDERRQELLRQHGSHEKFGGRSGNDTTTGGAKKGNQHDQGQARAKKQIREKYEAGEIE